MANADLEVAVQPNRPRPLGVVDGKKMRLSKNSSIILYSNQNKEVFACLSYETSSEPKMQIYFPIQLNTN